MLIIGGGIAFALAAVKAESITGTMQNLGWLMLCATALFLDPENPPGSVHPGTNEEDPIS
jgi:hypothetical protein